MKLVAAMAILMIVTSTAWATEKHNHVSCIYFDLNDNWEYYGYASSESFELKDGEPRMLFGAWTSERPISPN